MLATWKVLVSLAVVPLLYTFYAALATYMAYRYDLSLRWKRWTPFLTIWVISSMGYAALKFGEAGMDVAKSLRPLFLSLWPGNQREVDKLRDMRESLSNDISDIIDEFGPQLYENFNQARILPSATVPQTGKTPGMLYRKSQATDSSVLSHPILWLDERIFGWNRSATVGSIVWDGKERTPRSEPSTAPGSPAESDDEEYEADVDYDDVLAIIDNRRNGPGSPRGTRRGNGRSYRERSSTNIHAEKSPVRSPRGAPSPVGTNIPLPGGDEEGITRLHRRGKTAKDGADGNGEDGPVVGLGLDKGKDE